MISRRWRGLAKREQADKYVDHLRAETFPALKALPGFTSATILRRATAQGVEFIITTNWQSIEAILAFAGTDPEAAVVPPVAAAMMIEYDARVRHYEVLE